MTSGKDSEKAPSGRSPNGQLADLSIRVSIAFAILTALTYLLAPRLDLLYAIVSAILFFAGTFALGLGFWNGIQRSRIEQVRLTGLLAVDSSHVPASIRNRLWLSVVLQVVVTFGFAALRPFTQQAFGTLVPTLAVGLAALWGSRFAEFHPRDEP